MDPFRYNLHQDGGTGGRRGPSPTSTFPNYWPNYGPNMGLSAGMLWHRGPSTRQQIAIASKSASHRVTPTPTGSDCVTVNVWGLLWAVWHAQVLNCRLLPGSCPSVSLGDSVPDHAEAAAWQRRLRSWRSLAGSGGWRELAAWHNLRRLATAWARRGWKYAWIPWNFLEARALTLHFSQFNCFQQADAPPGGAGPPTTSAPVQPHCPTAPTGRGPHRAHSLHLNLNWRLLVLKLA